MYSASLSAGGKCMGPEGGNEPCTKGGGMKGSTRRWRLSRNSVGGSSGADRNCPGRVGGVPNTNLGEEMPDCSRGTLLRPRKTQGSSEGQDVEEQHADTRLRKGMKCIKGPAAEVRWKKWSIHAGLSGAEENMAAGEESPDDLEARISCRRCRTRQLHGGERLGVEERRHVGGGKARKLRRTERASAAALSTPGTC